LLATQPLKRLTLRAGVPMTRDVLNGAETRDFSSPWLHPALSSCPSLEYLALLDMDMLGSLELDGVYDGVISSLGSLPCLRELRVKIDDGTSEDIPAKALAKLLSMTRSLET
jgi:hypothetical protein